MRPIIPGARPYFSLESQERILKRVKRILETGHLTMGPMLAEFETQFADYVGVRHAIGVNSGATALLLALQYFNLEGGEVIVPVETFVASANAVILAGGHPRFVNIEPLTLCLDIDDVERNINNKTRGIMVVHLAGQITPSINELRKLCKEYNLFLIEDAAHGHGSKIGDLKAGNLGDVGCFSFYATKVITTGEGGMVTTNDNQIADFIRSARNHGLRKGSSLYETVSLNYRMTEMAAAVGLEQIRSLDDFVAQRNGLVNLYRVKLKGVPEIKFLPMYDEIVCSYWKLYVHVSETIDRDRLTQIMAEKYKVVTQYAYAPLCHQQPVFADVIEEPNRFKLSEEAMSQVICLPMFIGLKETEIAYIADCLKQAIKEASKS